MSILQIEPDPDVHLGGVALLRLPANAVAGDTTHVHLQNAYSQLWLAPTSGEDTLIQVGDGNWQSDPHGFGPYPVTRDGAELTLRIGPEIVNKLEEFVPVILRIDGRDHDAVWPDNVPPRAGAALIGALHAAAAEAPSDRGARLVGRRDQVREAPEEEVFDALPDPDETETFDDYDDETDTGEGTGNRRLVLLGRLSAALIAALAAIYFLTQPTQDDTPVAQPVTEETPVTPPEASPVNEVAPDCSLDTLAGLSGGFAATAEALYGVCGATVDAEGAFRLVERGAMAGDGLAWLALGALYDPNFADPLLEERLGVSPGDNLALAAEYYANARNAGVAEANVRLGETCADLATRTDTLSIGARDDFCP